MARAMSGFGAGRSARRVANVVNGMRILIVHSRYRSGTVSGENQVVTDEARLLRRAGHDVDVLSPTSESDGTRAQLRLARASFTGRETIKEIIRRQRRRRFDVIHFHNLFPSVSPAALRAGASAGSAVVQTLHNFRYFCVAGTLRRDERDCDLCRRRLPWPGVIHRCYRSSLPESAALASTIGLHRSLGSFDSVTLFVAVSDFVRRKHEQAGLDPDRIALKPHFVWPHGRRVGCGEGFVYVGRLSEEKGISDLVRWWPSVDADLLIIGSGPKEREIRGAATSRIRVLGAMSHEAALGHVRQARALVVPSKGAEAAGRAVLEAYSCGVPVISSAVGGLPEIVRDRETGFLVDADEGAWTKAIARLSDDSIAAGLGEGAWDAWRNDYAPDRGLVNLERVYERALEMQRAQS
jgi:glycosyltransferase involved in cell wall biosynthesis